MCTILWLLCSIDLQLEIVYKLQMHKFIAICVERNEIDLNNFYVQF